MFMELFNNKLICKSVVYYYNSIFRIVSVIHSYTHLCKYVTNTY